MRLKVKVHFLVYEVVIIQHPHGKDHPAEAEIISQVCKRTENDADLLSDLRFFPLIFLEEIL